MAWATTLGFTMVLQKPVVDVRETTSMFNIVYRLYLNNCWLDGFWWYFQGYTHIPQRMNPRVWWSSDFSSPAGQFHFLQLLDGLTQNNHLTVWFSWQLATLDHIKSLDWHILATILTCSYDCTRQIIENQHEVSNIKSHMCRGCWLTCIRCVGGQSDHYMLTFKLLINTTLDVVLNNK